MGHEKNVICSKLVNNPFKLYYPCVSDLPVGHWRWIHWSFINCQAASVSILNIFSFYFWLKRKFLSPAVSPFNQSLTCFVGQKLFEKSISIKIVVSSLFHKWPKTSILYVFLGLSSSAKSSMLPHRCVGNCIDWVRNKSSTIPVMDDLSPPLINSPSQYSAD